MIDYAPAIRVYGRDVTIRQVSYVRALTPLAYAVALVAAARAGIPRQALLCRSWRDGHELYAVIEHGRPLVGRELATYLDDLAAERAIAALAR